MSEYKIGVVIPTIRPEQFHQWLDSFRHVLEKPEYHVNLYVCEDNPTKTFTIDEQLFSVFHYDWADIDKDLGDQSWIIPRRSDVIRSYGFLKAYHDGCDYIATFDDDVRISPTQDIIAEYLEGFSQFYDNSAYANVGYMFGYEEFMRGYPFSERKTKECWVQYGNWHNVPDFDAVTQLQQTVPDGHKSLPGIQAIPKGMACTSCIMNAMFDRRAIPFAYQLLQGQKRPDSEERYLYDRWGDIWSGLLIKKALDRLDKVYCVNGNASVIHTRASEPYRNLKNECTGYGVNEQMWDNLHLYPWSDSGSVSIYKDLAEQMQMHFEVDNPEYGDSLLDAMRTWSVLVSEGWSRNI